jgi:hypothetical protein
MIGAVTLPPGAPWRGRSWASIKDRLPAVVSRPPAYHACMSGLLGSTGAAAKVMRDDRHFVWNYWVFLGDKAINGLGWVLHDGTEKRTTEAQGQEVLGRLYASRPDGCAWTPDDIVAWAEVCADYVDAYRRKW